MSINYAVRRTSSIALICLFVQTSSYAWLFGGPVKEVGVRYLEKLRYASYAQFGSVFDWRLVLLLLISTTIFALGSASSGVIGTELSKRILSGRLRLRTWLRRGLHFRQSQRDPITLSLHR
jgi:hypothetical protein